MGTFDLRDTLANRAYPTTSVKVWMDEKVFFEIAALNRKITDTPNDDKKAITALESELEQKLKQRDDEAFRVHIRAISKRSRNDLQTEAFSQMPIIRDVYGREDEKRTWQRSNLLSELYFAEHITKVVDPMGNEQVFTEDNKRDLARAFLGEAPDFSVEVVDQAIGALRGEKEMKDYSEQSVDFLSHT